jgi:hypothetical protein
VVEEEARPAGRRSPASVIEGGTLAERFDVLVDTQTVHPATFSWAASGADVRGEVLAGEGGAAGDEVGRGALEDDPAAVVAGAGA